MFVLGKTGRVGIQPGMWSSGGRARALWNTSVESIGMAVRDCSLWRSRDGEEKPEMLPTQQSRRDAAQILHPAQESS